MHNQIQSLHLPIPTNPILHFLLKSLGINKASRLDKILPKLVKATSDILSTPLSQAINNSLMNGIFPNAGKVAMISPIDKKSDDKNII